MLLCPMTLAEGSMKILGALWEVLPACSIPEQVHLPGG